MCGGSERADAEELGEVGLGAASEERGWEIGERREGGEVWRRTTCQLCPPPRSDLRRKPHILVELVLGHSRTPQT